MYQTDTTITAINKTLDGIEARNWRGTFKTFTKFADAVAANLPTTATKDEAAHLCAVLTAARDARGTLMIRISYAAHLARHAAANPLTR
jgi:hypothetical protein